MKMYELTPSNGRKSFGGKANVVIEDNGNEVLFSYDTRVMTKKPDGTLLRHWSGWSSTTGNHVIAFCGLKKKEYDKLDVVN